jgi:hypothetical protein
VIRRSASTRSSIRRRVAAGVEAPPSSICGLKPHVGLRSARRGSNQEGGVDLNRNFSVGSFFDGYVGASSSCTSDTFAGPGEFSEPESRNEQWVQSTFTNAPAANDAVTIGFSQHVGATDALRTGAYSQTLTFTLSTTTP